jgi:hypothetical protein
MPSTHAPQLAQAPAPIAVEPDLRLTLSEPTAEPAPAPTAVEATLNPISYSGNGGGVDYIPYRDPHMELADLLFAHEQF